MSTIVGISPKFSQAHMDLVKATHSRFAYMQWLSRQALAGMIDLRCNNSYDSIPMSYRVTAESKRDGELGQASKATA